MKMPELKDFGLTEEMIAAAKEQESQALAKENLKQLTIFATAAAAVSIIALIVAAKEWRHSGLFSALGEFIAVFLLGAFALIMLLVWQGEGESNKRQKHPVLQRLDQFNAAVCSYDSAMERRRREFWETLDGWSFEHELAEVLRKVDYKAEVTRGSGDDGVDIWAEKDGETIAIQCKRYSGAVGPAVVRELYGVLLHFEADRGIVATTGYFTGGAFDFAEDKQIELWTLNDILRLQDSSEGSCSTDES
jgi:restriction system protein